MNGRHLGSLVGTIGGIVFVLANLGGLELSAVAAVILVGIAVMGVVAVLLAIRADDAEPPPVPTRRSITVYWVAVAAMVVAIPAGSALLSGLDLSRLQPCWVVLAVGAHFVPFARVFGADLFLGLAASLIGVALLGAVVTLAGVDRAPAGTGVLAGLVLLGWSWAGPACADGIMKDDEE